MTSFRSGPSSHALMVGDAVCPTCERPIPHEQAQKVWERFKAHGETLAKAQIEKVQSESASAIEKVKAELIAQQTAARSAGIKEAQAAAQEKLAEAERQKKEALERVENFEVNMELAINQVREVKDTEMNAIRAEHFKDTLKWKDKVQSLASWRRERSGIGRRR